LNVPEELCPVVAVGWSAAGHLRPLYVGQTDHSQAGGPLEPPSAARTTWGQGVIEFHIVLYAKLQSCLIEKINVHKGK